MMIFIEIIAINSARLNYTAKTVRKQYKRILMGLGNHMFDSVPSIYHKHSIYHVFTLSNIQFISAAFSLCNSDLITSCFDYCVKLQTKGIFPSENIINYLIYGLFSLSINCKVYKILKQWKMLTTIFFNKTRCHLIACFPRLTLQKPQNVHFTIEQQ